MKKIFCLILAFLPIISYSQIYSPNENNWDNWKTITFGDFMIRLPQGCAYSEDKSMPDDGCFCWTTPDKSVMLVLCYFPFGEDFSQVERLIGEAAQFGIELTNDGDIAHMKLDDTRYLSLAFTEDIAIGVSEFYPNDKVGVYFCAIAPNKNNQGNTAVDIITGIRIK